MAKNSNGEDITFVMDDDGKIRGLTASAKKLWDMQQRKDAEYRARRAVIDELLSSAPDFLQPLIDLHPNYSAPISNLLNGECPNCEYDQTRTVRPEERCETIKELLNVIPRVQAIMAASEAPVLLDGVL